MRSCFYCRNDIIDYVIINVFIFSVVNFVFEKKV